MHTLEAVNTGSSGTFSSRLPPALHPAGPRPKAAIVDPFQVALGIGRTANTLFSFHAETEAKFHTETGTRNSPGLDNHGELI